MDPFLETHPVSTVAFGHKKLTFDIKSQGDYLKEQFLKIKLPALLSYHLLTTGEKGYYVDYDNNYYSSTYQKLAGVTPVTTNSHISLPLVIDPCDPLKDFEFSQESTTCNPDGPWVHWVNSVGFHMIERVALYLDGHLTREFSGHMLYIMSELDRNAQTSNVASLTGREDLDRSKLIDLSSRQQVLHIPLHWFPFEFPLHLKRNLKIRVEVNLLDLEYCLQRDSSYTFVEQINKFGSISSIQKNCIEVSLISSFRTAKIDSLYNNKSENRINFTQIISKENIFFNSPAFTFQFQSNGYLKHLVWTVQRKGFLEQNYPFNYSGFQGLPILKKVQILVNNDPVSKIEEPSFYSKVQPFQKFGRVPLQDIYVFNFDNDGEISLRGKIEIKIEISESLATRNESYVFNCYMFLKNEIRIFQKTISVPK